MSKIARLVTPAMVAGCVAGMAMAAVAAAMLAGALRGGGEDGLAAIADGAVAVSASDLNACALRQSGAVVCWGGSALEVSIRGLTDVPPGRYRSVSMGAGHACAVRESGGVVCWGALTAQWGDTYDYEEGEPPRERYGR